MADFDSEELRRIMQNLADRLANTKGDENIVEKLQAVERAIAKLDKTIDSGNKKSKAEKKRERDDTIKDLVKEFNNLPVLNELKETIEEQGANGSGPGQGNINTQGFNPKSFTSAVGQSIIAFGKFSNTLANVSMGIVQNMGNLDGSLKNFATSLGISGSSATAGFLAVVDENVDALRTLLDSAEGTVGSIMDLREAMSQSALGATEFSKAIAQGTQGTRQLGAQPWAQLYSSIKAQTKDMAYYGYTTQGLITAQNDYLEIVSNRGEMFEQKTTNATLTKGLNDLLQVNNEVAAILGKTREEALAEAKKQSRDADLQAFMRTMDGEIKKAAETTIGLFSQTDANLGAMFKDMFMNNGALSDDTAKVAALMPPEMVAAMQDLAMRLKNGEITQKQAAEEYRKTAQVYKDNVNDQQIQQYGQLANITGQEQFKAANQIDQAIRELDLKPAKDQNLGTSLSDALTKAALSMEQLAKETSAGVQDALTQFIFQPLTDFGDYVLSGFQSLDGFIQKLRDTVAYLGTFDSAVKLIVGVIAGGALLNGVAGVVTSVVGSVFTKQIFKFVSLIAGPIAELTKGIFRFSASLGTTLVKSLSSAVTTAISGSGLASGLAGKAAGLAVAAGGGYILDAGLGAIGVGGNEIDQAQDDSNWDKMNVAEKIESGLARGIEKAGSLLFLDNLANSAKAQRIKDETEYLEGRQPEEVNPAPAEVSVEKPSTEPVELAPDSSGWLIKSLDNNSFQLERLGQVLSESISQGYFASEISRQLKDQMVVNSEIEPINTQSEMEDLHNRMLAQIEMLTENNQLPEDMIDNISKRINLDDMIKLPELSRIDVGTPVEPGDKTQAAQTAAMNNFYVQAQGVLERIYQTLKITYEYSRENDQVVRDRLAELNKLQEDLIRVSKR